MNLFQTGRFALHSGAESRFKIECDALTDADWDTLAQWTLAMLGPFRAVVGIPSGGTLLAERLNSHVSINGPLLVVDDVLTTGKSIVETMDRYRKDGAPWVAGFVIFARGPLPPATRALFFLNEAAHR